MGGPNILYSVRSFGTERKTLKKAPALPGSVNICSLYG